MTHVAATAPTNAFRWQQCFFSHRMKLRDLLLSKVSLAALPATGVCVQQPHATNRLLP